LTINWIISQVKKNSYILSKHNEQLDDILMISEIEEAIFSGSILESYSNSSKVYNTIQKG